MMTAWLFRSIHDTKSATFIPEVSRDSIKPRKMVAEQGNNFFGKTVKNLYLRKVTEGRLCMIEFESNLTFRALEHRTPKNTKIYLYIFRFSAKSSMF